MQPLSTGHRDPLDGRDGPSLRRVWCSVTVHPTSPTVLVRGYGVRDLLMRAGLKPLYSVSGRGWTLDELRLPDIVAVLEWGGYGITLTERAVVA